jgi:hypothetical protein
VYEITCWNCGGLLGKTHSSAPLPMFYCLSCAELEEQNLRAATEHTGEASGTMDAPAGDQS